MTLKRFSQKLAFFVQNTSVFCRIWIITFFRKLPTSFAENLRKYCHYLFNCLLPQLRILHIFNTELGIFNTELGIFNTELGIFNTELGIFNTELGIFNT
jgi:hypothetical protein